MFANRTGPTKRQKEQRRADRKKAKAERMAQRKARKQHETAPSIEPPADKEPS